MDAKAQIEAARKVKLANDVVDRGRSLEWRYLLIRNFVRATLNAEYVSYYDINYAMSKNRYSEQKLLDLHSKVWGEK